MGAAAIVGLGVPALKVALGDVTSGFVAFEIDSRIHRGKAMLRSPSSSATCMLRR